MAGFVNDVIYGVNIDFSGGFPVSPQILNDGQLLIGANVFPNIRAGFLTSLGGTIAITNGAGTINLETLGAAATTYQADAGSATPAGNILNVLGANGITTTGAGNTLTITTTNGEIATNFNVDANTAPGTDPVVPDAAGTVTITGAQVAAGVIGANVIRTDSLAANTYTIEIQRSAAVAGSAALNNGVSHFNSAQFTVDGNGFVSTVGGSVVVSIDVDANTPPGTDPVVPTAGGVITITGAQVAAGVVGANVIRTDSLAANAFTIEIQRTAAVVASDSVNNGVAHFDSDAFDVDGNGFVQLNGGGIAATNFNVDASTPPGTDPVVPSAAGTVTITGGQVAAGTIGANVIQTNSLAANTYAIQIQRSAASAAPDSTLNGVAHFNSAQFTVDAAGFVSSVGGGSTLSINVDANTPPGTDPVVPNGSGVITMTGAQVAAGTVGANVIRTDSLAANTMTIEIQRTAAAAASTSVNNGVAHFDSARFTVDGNGFVSINGAGVGETITGDTGGPLSPTAGNWNILSTTTNGIQTTGLVSTLTVGMLSPYADADFSFESQVGGVTRTLAVQNTVDAASSSARMLVQVEGAASGNPFMQFNIDGAETYALGLRNDSNDDFVISRDVNLGTLSNQALRIVQTNNALVIGDATAAATNDACTVTRDTNGMVQFSVQNRDTTTGRAIIAMRTGVGATGDLVYQYLPEEGVGGDTVTHGIDYSDAQAWKMGSQGVDNFSSAVNMVVTQTGEVTFPRTPAFLAFNAAANANQTGNGTVATVPCDSEVFDQGGNYNNATFTFTAPVTGRYNFATSVLLSNIGAAHTLGLVSFVTSNRTYSWGYMSPAVVRTSGNAASMTGGAYCDMDAADTAVFQVQVSNSTLTITIEGSAPNTFFSGMLAS